MPTTYPKCTPTELLGLLVLLKDHGGAQDLARLADDLDLEIDEILPASDFAEALRLVNVEDGRMTFTEVGKHVVEATIRDRKALIRDELQRTTLFSTLVRALESAPGGRMTDEDVGRLIALTAAPTDDMVMNIVNWGRFTELFRYDPESHQITLIRRRATRPPPPVARSPPKADTPSSKVDSGAAGVTRPPLGPARTSPVAA